MAYDVNKLNLRWAVGVFGTWQQAIERAENEAITILHEEDPEDMSLESATEFMQTASNMIHAGDCSEARSWLVAPVTCGACVYDEYMAKAWERLRPVPPTTR